MRQEDQIQYWTHMLDESMGDKAAEKAGFADTCRELGYSDEQAEKLWEKAADVVQAGLEKMEGGFGGDVEATSDDLDDFSVCCIDATGHMENDGIGAYEYWGEKCYDRGNAYVELDEIRFDEGDALNALAAIGMSAEFEDIEDVEISWGDADEDYGACSGSLNVDGRFVVTDRTKFAEWAAKQI